MTVPGTRWIARRGRHTGTQAEVVKTTGGDRVVIRMVGSTGTSWNKRKSGSVYTLGRDQFLATYVPRDQPSEEPLMVKHPPVEQNGTAPSEELDRAEVEIEAPAPRHGPGRSPKLSDGDIAEVLRLYQDPSVGVREIQQAYGLKPVGLYRMLKKHGIPTRLSSQPSVPAPTTTRQWTISFNVMTTQTVAVGAASVDEALRAIRGAYGQSIDVVQVQRTDA